MQLESRYNLYLDYKGYQIEPQSYRASPSPLMGTKFTTGRSAYSDLDFWQIGAMTDFSKGLNQKYMVDPSAYFNSIGIYPGKPGELSLERDTATFSGQPATPGVITAHYRRLDELYIGSSTGKIMKSSDGVTFSLVHTATGTDKQIYDFYEIAGRFFATTAGGNIWCNEDPDNADTWTKEAVSTQFPLPAYDQTPSSGQDVYGTKLAVMTFKVPMSGSTFETLKVKIKKTGTPGGDIVFTIHEEDADNVGQPGTQVTGASFTIAQADVGTSYAWEEKDITEFDLRAGVIYYLEATASAATVGAKYIWGYEEGSKSTYDAGNAKDYDGADWTDRPYRSMYFEFRRETITDLYYVMIESDYGFGWFSDGIRRTIDGYNWIPEPPDPLWVMPSGEGVPLNAVSIPKSFISGSKRGLWGFVGGSSGINIWDFPDYSNSNNFRGLEKWGHFAIFSIEEQGIYYTDGSQVIPTTMSYLNEGFTFKSCKHIYSSGWDVYALVSDDSSTWYLARCNLNYHSQPKYWWIVKELKSEPSRIVGYDDNKVFIFYADQTAESFDKVAGPYVTSGYLETSLLDENLIKIQKLYNNTSAILSSFSGNSQSGQSTSVQLSYKIDRQANYISSATTYGKPETKEVIYGFPNPTLGNRLRLKLTLGGDASDTSTTPICTDLTWKYILEKPAEDVTTKKNFQFTVLAEDSLEDNFGDKEVPRQNEPTTNVEIQEDIWSASGKKEVLNFIGADNVSEVAFEIESSHATKFFKISIDRTNYTISLATVDEGKNFTGNANIGGGQNEYSYKDKTLTEVATGIAGLETTLTVTVHQDQNGLKSANDLEPIKDRVIKRDETTNLMIGTDVHAVIMGASSPSQSKLALDGRASDRLQVALREA